MFLLLYIQISLPEAERRDDIKMYNLQSLQELIDTYTGVRLYLVFIIFLSVSIDSRCKLIMFQH
jgi:hypothetical protein